MPLTPQNQAVLGTTGIRHNLRTYFAFFQTKAFRDTSTVFIANVVGTVVSLVGVLVIQRVLDYSALGTLAIYNNVVTLAAGIILGGMNTVTVRFVSQFLASDPGVAKGILRSVLRIQLILAAVALLVLGFFAPQVNALFFDKPELIPYIQLAGAGVALTLLTSFYQTIFQSQQRFRLYAIITIVQATLGTAGVFALKALNMLTAKGYVTFTLGLMLCIFVASVILYFTSSLARIPRKPIPKETLRTILRYSKWVVVMTTATFIFLKLDVFMLTSYVSLKEVALYSFANSIYTAYLLILSTVNTILLPKMSQLQKYEDFRNAIKTVSRVSTLLTIATIPTFFAIRPLIHMVFQDKFDASMPVLALMLGGFVVSLLLNPVVNFLLVMQQEKFLAIVTVVQLFLHIIGNLIFIPRYGNMGAVGVTTVTIIFVNLVGFIRIFHTLRKLQGQQLHNA